MKQPTSAFTLAIVLLCSGLTAPAAAKSHRIVVVAPPKTVVYQVIYDGLNLATADGAKALYRQVAQPFLFVARVRLLDGSEGGHAVIARNPGRGGRAG